MSEPAPRMPSRRPFERPVLEVTSPDRRSGGFYRTADRAEQGIPGVPLASTEAVVVSAVRMGYKVAAEQIDRSARAARRLRDAAERAAGPEPERQTADAADRLVLKAMIAALAWWDAFSADPTHPLRKIAAAELELVASLLRPGRPRNAAEAQPEDASAKRTEPQGGGAPAAQAPNAMPRIVHRGQSERRAVSVTRWELDGALGDHPLAIVFYAESVADAEPIEGEVHGTAGRPVLAITTSRAHLRGAWLAPICNADGEQIGVVQITL